MIARIWRGRVPASKADAYYDVLQRTGISDYRSTPGNRDCWVLRRRDGDVVHFLLVTLWDSWEAIRAFAGDDPDVARYYAEDPDYLLELEPRVVHYELLEDEAPPSA